MRILRALGFLLFCVLLLPPYVAAVLLALPYLLLQPLMGALNKYGSRLTR